MLRLQRRQVVGAHPQNYASFFYRRFRSDKTQNNYGTFYVIDGARRQGRKFLMKDKVGLGP